MLCMTFCLFGAWAIDGDTIGFYDKEGVRHSLRLWGADAYERSEPQGPAATQALSSLIQGQMLECDITHPGSYGRFVGQCILPDGRDLSCVIISQGHAVELLSFSKGYYDEC